MNENDFSKYNGFWANVKTYHLSQEDLQFIRWKYNKEYSKIVVGTTPVFKKNIPKGYQYMTNIQRSYNSVKNLMLGRHNMDERELYRQDMKKAEAVNRFF